MLSGMLLDDTQRGQFKDSAAHDEALPLRSEALLRATSGLRSYAVLRGGGPAQEVAAASEDDHRAAFNDTSAAVAEAANHLPKNIPDGVVDAIPDLFEQGAAGAAAVRAYWVELGFSPSEVDPYLAEAVAARAGLADLARLILVVADWKSPLAHFGASHPDYRNWGLGFSTDGTLHEDARAFTAASRKAGVTPSLYLMSTMVLLLDKLATELAEA